MPAIEDFDMRPTRALINSLMASNGDAETIFNGLHAALDRIETLEIEVERLKIAAKNATQGSRNQPTECPCVFCERSHAEHEVFRSGYLAGLRGDGFDTNPHDDEPWNREAWDDGWKLGHAEWERYNPEPDESEDEPCRNRLKEAIPGIDGVYFWCPECHGRLAFGDGKTVVDYETELRKRLGGQVKCEDCGEALEIPMDVQFERVEDPE